MIETAGACARQNVSGKSDVLIVGGGVIGLACAYYLLKAGRSVVILEQDRIGSGASHGNSGLIAPSHITPLCAPGTVKSALLGMLRKDSFLHIKPDIDPQRWQWLLGFARKCTHSHLNAVTAVRAALLKSSKCLLEELLETEPIDCEYENRGTLLVFKQARNMQAYGAHDAFMKLFGLQVQTYAGNELRQLEAAFREDVYGAHFYPANAHLRPDMLMDGWKRCIQAAGGCIVENCSVQRIDNDRRGVTRIQSTRGNFRADHYVLAAGAWSPRFARQLNIRIPIQPGRGYSLHLARTCSGPAIPCLLMEKRVAVTPFRDGYRLAGFMELCGYDPRINAGHFRSLVHSAAAYLKTDPAAPIRQEWTGWRPMTYDDLPIIGRSPRQPNLMLAVGHGMKGMATATATGKLVAEMITGARPHLDPAPFAATRFQ